MQGPNTDIQTWSAKGMRVFKLTKSDLRGKPPPHVLAVNQPAGFSNPCNPLMVGKYYAHLYHTKVEVGVRETHFAVHSPEE